MPQLAQPKTAVRPPLRTGTDQAAARRSLRTQIARLERELARTFAAAYPRRGIEWKVGSSSGGPRVLDVGQLEEVRDGLAERLEEARAELRRRALIERGNAETIERMIAEPGRFKWVRVSNHDIGEPGCKHWHSRPRLGLIGMLLGWWRIRISSGCP
jgi:hypothetical protein